MTKKEQDDRSDILTREDRKIVEAEEKDALALAERVEGVVVESQEGLDAASGLLKVVKRRSVALEEARKQITKPLNAALRAANDLFRTPADVLKKAESTLKRAAGAYLAEVERRRAAAEAEARRKAEKERVALEKKALAAEKKGNEDRAADIRERASAVVAAEPEPEAKAPKGVSTRQSWRAEVTDLKALVKGVASGKVPLEAVQANTMYLNGVSRSMKAEMKFPGVSSVSKSVVAVG